MTLRTSTLRAAALVPLALSLAACAGAEQMEQQAQLRTESECRAAADSAKCKLEHDLAGGYPFVIYDYR